MYTPRLCVIGDSFSVPPLPQDTSNPAVYTRLVQQALSRQHGTDIEIINNSIMGASQDWIWKHLQQWLEHDITSEDYIIIALTHPSRMWFVDRLPDLTNINISDLDKHVTREEASAIMMYVKHIQRPQLDLMNINNRFGYLGYQILKKSLRKPLVIKCFDQDLDQALNWNEFMLAQGVLMDHVQRLEFEESDINHGPDYWQGIDCRYNHMCLTNHAVLAEKIVTAFNTDTAPDLTQGFVKNLLNSNSLDDADFVQRELDVCTYQHNQQFSQHYASKTSWAQRIGLKRFN